jgi:formyl-CoA transferase
MGNRSASGAYADLVRCAGAGVNDYVYLMLPPDNAEPFEALVQIIGRDDLGTDARFSTPPARASHIEDLTAVIEGWTMKRDKHEVMRAFAGRGIPCGAVLDTAEVLADPHLRERGMVFDLEHPTRGRFAMIGSPVRLSDSPIEVSPAPLFGEHTEDVLRTLAGYSADDVQRLREKGVLESRP